ncbi:MAG TPA: phosphotransferase, partial [Candidatus Berkiella sp.]|nr:phosphotransferase [Candidatus Berkiella sp.]
MVLPNHRLGIIDFQDAMIGPITYDLVSLLKDCYIAWPLDRVHRWALDFYNMLHEQQRLKEISCEQFIEWFDCVGLQRHLKVLGIFSRLKFRDNKANYLNDIPR